MDEAIVGVMAATIVGALVGALLGCIVGPLVGGIARAFGPGSKLTPMVFGVTISTFGAVIVSVFAIRFLTGRELELSALRYVIAVASAIGTGFVGGVVLVRGVMRLLWPDTVLTPAPVAGSDKPKDV